MHSVLLGKRDPVYVVSDVRGAWLGLGKASSRIVHHHMRRTVIAGTFLALSSAFVARGKTETLVFIFRGLDQAENVAILRPMIAPDIGVQLDKGPRELKRGTVLHCTASTREHPAIVEGQVAKIGELLLDCGDHKFVVKGLDFTQRAK